MGLLPEVLGNAVAAVTSQEGRGQYGGLVALRSARARGLRSNGLLFWLPLLFSSKR